MERREFVKKSSVGVLSLTSLYMCDILEQEDAFAFPTSGGMGIEEGCDIVERGKEKNVVPEIRAEIKNNPRSVFIIETHVDAQKDEKGTFDSAIPQIQAEGKRCAQYIFTKGTNKGGSTFIKPNFTAKPEHAFYRTSGVYTQPDFIVGTVEHLREIGNTNIMTGETATAAINRRRGKVYEAFDPAGIPMIEPGYARWTDYNKNEVNWKNTRNSLFWKRIPYFRPIGDDDTFLVDMATLKCHLTGLTTLTVKNLQGTVPRGFGQFCTAWNSFEAQATRMGIDMSNFYDDWQQRIEASFVKHRDANFKRWDPQGTYPLYQAKGGWAAYSKAKKDSPEALTEFMKGVGSLMQYEMWLQRGLDNADTIRPQINIIAGIIGLDGEELNRNQIGTDQLVNVVIAGCSPYEVDAVGSYVMGHDPRELWYTRVAKERGLGECDVNKIAINKILDNGDIVPIKNISEVKRHPLGLNWARQKDPNERLFW